MMDLDKPFNCPECGCVGEVLTGLDVVFTVRLECINGDCPVDVFEVKLNEWKKWVKWSEKK